VVQPRSARRSAQNKTNGRFISVEAGEVKASV